MVIGQYVHAHFSEMPHPFLIAEEIFMVARTHEHAIARAQVAQRLDIRPAHREAAVDDIACYHDQIDIERFCTIDNSPRPPAGNRRLMWRSVSCTSW